MINTISSEIKQQTMESSIEELPPSMLAVVHRIGSIVERTINEEVYNSSNCAPSIKRRKVSNESVSQFRLQENGSLLAGTQTLFLKSVDPINFLSQSENANEPLVENPLDNQVISDPANISWFYVESLWDNENDQFTVSQMTSEILDDPEKQHFYLFEQECDLLEERNFFKQECDLLEKENSLEKTEQEVLIRRQKGRNCYNKQRAILLAGGPASEKVAEKFERKREYDKKYYHTRKTAMLAAPPGSELAKKWEEIREKNKLAHENHKAKRTQFNPK